MVDEGGAVQGPKPHAAHLRVMAGRAEDCAEAQANDPDQWTCKGFVAKEDGLDKLLKDAVPTSPSPFSGSSSSSSDSTSDDGKPLARTPDGTPKRKAKSKAKPKSKGGAKRAAKAKGIVKRKPSACGRPST